MKKKTLLLIGAGYVIGGALWYSSAYTKEPTPPLKGTPPPPPPPPPEPVPGVLPGEVVDTGPAVTPVPTPAPPPAPPTLEEMKANADLERLASTNPAAHGALMDALGRYDVATLVQYAAQLVTEYPALSAHIGEVADAINAGQEPSRIVLNPQPVSPSATAVVGGTAPRWTFWYTLRWGANNWVVTEPEVLTATEAHALEFRTQLRYPGAKMYRFVYEPKLSPTWMHDTRTQHELHAQAPLRRPTYA